jgi:hypothetical protein
MTTSVMCDDLAGRERAVHQVVGCARGRRLRGGLSRGTDDLGAADVPVRRG